MRLDRYFTLGIARSAKLFPPNGQRRFLPVLMYHSISNHKEAGVHPYYRIATSPERFKEQMIALYEAGYTIVGLNAGMKWFMESERDEKVVVVTFDDGYRDFYSNAAPLLIQLGCSATMFLPTSLIGKTRQYFKDHSCMTWSEVRELHGLGIEFGSHTVSHPKLWKLTRDELIQEVQDSKRHIEDQLGNRINTFAYPYAFPSFNEMYKRLIFELLEWKGYRYAVTTNIGRMFDGNHCYQIPRLPVNELDDPKLLLAKVEGAYDWVAWPQAAFKRLKQMIKSAKQTREN